MLATGYTKLGWREVPGEMRRLVEALAAVEPTYRLPPATLGHTRHYMPVYEGSKVNSADPCQAGVSLNERVKALAV